MISLHDLKAVEQEHAIMLSRVQNAQTSGWVDVEAQQRVYVLQDELNRIPASTRLELARQDIEAQGRANEAILLARLDQAKENLIELERRYSQ